MDDVRRPRGKEANEAHRSLRSVTSELFRLFAQDTSEKANISAINAIQDAFQAAAAALFYITGEKVFQICLAGVSYPVELPEARWRACVEMNGSADEVNRFGPWSIPVLEKKLPAWISVCLYLSGDEGGYVFLGKEEGSWTEADADALASLKEAIAPVSEVRHQRGIAEHLRKETEQLLAKNERRLRDLFEGTRDMIYTADADDIITSVNRSAVTMLGYDAKEELVGRAFSTLALNPEDRALFLSRMVRDGYVDDYEIILRRRDESPVFCLETAHAVKEPSGTVRELQGIVKDISGRIENEKKQWRMNLELAEANLKLKKTQAVMVQHEKLASIGQLAAGVAHEINNPLGFLTSNHAMLKKYLEKIKTAWLESSQTGADSIAKPESVEWFKEAFDEIDTMLAESQDGFKRITKIVSGLKDFSRVNNAREFGDFDLNSGIESTLVVAWNEIKYVSEVRKNLGQLPLIRANGSELNQVILNILVNAAHAISSPGGQGKGVIEIATRFEEDRVHLSIADNGPGIPETIRNKIFDPFFTTKEPGKGTGLGLSISYDIVVNKHGGSLWVESEAETGTTFHISLPVAGPALEPKE